MHKYGPIQQVTVPEGKSGKWAIKRFEVTDHDVGTLRLALQGRAIAIGTYTKLTCEGRGIVMSDTPAEMRDHYEFVRNAKGHVLINGLGLGMCLDAALRKPEVTFVTVVESELDVIKLVAPHYYSERVQIIHSCAFSYKPPKGIRYGAVWHDIWDTICSDNLEEMTKLHRKYGRLADWQGSWGKDSIMRMRRQERGNKYRYW